MKIQIKTINQLLKGAKFRDNFKILPQGKTFKDLSTIIIIPNRGTQEEKKELQCKKCKTKNEYVSYVQGGFDPVFVQAWKNLVKPMNVPVLEMVVPGREVGAAYNTGIEMILNNPALSKFKYILTVEDDNIIPGPNPQMPQGPLMTLYEDIEQGFDVAGGLYWTKGSPSMPLIYGDPKEVRGKKNVNDQAGMFKVRFDWQKKPLAPIECNGMGCGFTLFKLDIFKDKRLSKPWFKTVNGWLKKDDGKEGPASYTQDLFFFEKIRKLGYKVCVDTRVKLGHMDFKTGQIY